MATPPVPYRTITISSGRLCYGALHNIWHGASAPPVQGLPKIRAQSSGTLRVHDAEFNVAARNGTWNAFQLVSLEDHSVGAWFLAHSDVDVEKEMDKILRVSGAAHELDSGSRMNDDKTESEGILVINRYDWGWYNSRGVNEVGDVEENQKGESLGIVDFAEAKAAVLRWKEDQRPDAREWSEGAAWLHIPQGPYMFGRFGFDDDHVAARSFLFFTTDIYFTETAFAGLDKPLKKKETEKERYERSSREGCDWSGIDAIRSWAKPPEGSNLRPMFSPLPSMDECFGPYDPRDHVLRRQDIDALRVHRKQTNMRAGEFIDPSTKRIGDFIDPWAEPLFDLVNEMLLSYLELRVVPRMRNQASLAAACKALFPRSARSGPLQSGDAAYLNNFLGADEKGIPNFDYTFVAGRIKAFLSRFEDQRTKFEDECIAGITRVIARLFAEVFELAHYSSANNMRTKILPCDIRTPTFQMSRLGRILQFSRVFWEGRAAP